MGLVDLTYINHLTPFLHERLPYILRHGLYVGVPIGDKFLTMVGLVQEYGATIKAHNSSGYLWIPTPAAEGRKPGEIPGLYVRHRKGSDGAAAGYNEQYSPNGFCVCFVLKQSVNIPPRAFIFKCVQHNEDAWNILIAKKLFQVMMNQVSIEDFFKIIGDRMVNDLKDTITAFSQPPNAKLTIENKGKDDPLMDTGKLRDSIQAVLI